MIDISADHRLADEAIRNFVEAYNTFQVEMQKQVGFYVEEGTEGALRSDSMARNLIQSVRSMISATVPGIDSGFNTLANLDRKSTRLNSSHVASSYAVFCLKKKME